jgi:uncharacterized membrane protein
VLLLLGLVYPYAGTYARKGGFGSSPTLDGLRWLRASAPGDPAAIDWLRANTSGGAVVLEAVGEDYSAFGPSCSGTTTRALAGRTCGRSTRPTITRRRAS